MHGGVDVPGRLVRAEHVEEPEGEHGQAVRRTPGERVPLGGELAASVGRHRAGGEVFVLGQGGVRRRRRSNCWRRWCAGCRGGGRLRAPSRCRWRSRDGGERIGDAARHAAERGEVDDGVGAVEGIVERVVVEDRALR